MNLGVSLATAAFVFPAELPDKTLVATLVLATRYRGAPVLLGVSAAFAVQCLIAVTAGQLLGLLPPRLVLLVAGGLFAVGSVILLRAEGDAPAEAAPEQAARPGGWRAVLTSLGVLFAAEWGDASQLLTAGLTARYDDPVAVFAGAWPALVAVALLAVLLGRVIVRRVPLRAVRRAAGVLLATLAAASLVEAARG